MRISLLSAVIEECIFFFFLCVIPSFLMSDDGLVLGGL